MIFLAEIALSIWVMKRGWGPKAFLPLAFAIILGLVMGVLGAIAGIDRLTVILCSLPIDMVLIASLIAMGVKGRENVAEPQPEMAKI